MEAPRRCCGGLGEGGTTAEGGEDDTAVVEVLLALGILGREVNNSTREERRRFGEGRGSEV